MKRLDMLIRARQWQLDERRRQVADLEVSVDLTLARIRSLDSSIDSEARLADQVGPGAGFAAYAAGVRERRSKLVATLETLEAELAQARDLVAEAFQDLKKFELVQESRRSRERAVAAHREQFALDEIAALRHRAHRG
ncbi:MAG: flagellar FliJ family protein [Alphaproteobacteria bacterium]